jgi:adenine phosphoribosyltransferase
MQADSIQQGQTVIVVDDLIATGRRLHTCKNILGNLQYNLGGSAKAAGDLVAQQGGKTVEYLFVIELAFLKGHEKLDAPLYSIIQSDD